MVFFRPAAVISSGAQILDGIVDTDDLAAGAVTNAKVDAAAAIAYSKLDLSASVVNADIGAAAAIADTKLAAISTAGKVDGAALTGFASIPAGAGTIPAANAPSPAMACGLATRAADTASGSQTIAHGLGKAPGLVMLFVECDDFAAANEFCQSEGAYDGTNTVCKRHCALPSNPAQMKGTSATYAIELIDQANTDKQQATVGVDATNITLTWTKTGAPSANTMQILWVAVG